MDNSILIWIAVAVIGVLSLAIAAVGLRRRLERGRQAKFQIGLGVGLIDVIEGLTAKQLSPHAQLWVFAANVAGAVLAIVLGITIIAIRNGVRL